MSGILDFDFDKLAKLFFGSTPNDIKQTVFITLGIPWLFDKIKRHAFVVKKNEGWFSLAVMRYKGNEATLISVTSGASEVTDAVRLLRKSRCKNVVGIGLAGALKETIQIGDILVPIRCTKALNENNESYCHSKELYSAYKHELAAFCSRNNVSLSEGNLCTVESITDEDSKFFSEAQNSSFSAVDLETFFLFKEAIASGFNVSSFHVISDNPVVHKSFLDDMTDYDIARKRNIYQKLPTLIKTLIATIS